MSAIGEISDSSQGQVMALAVLRDDFGIITVAQDSSVRVWLKRSNGQVGWQHLHHLCTSNIIKLKFVIFLACFKIL